MPFARTFLFWSCLAFIAHRVAVAQPGVGATPPAAVGRPGVKWLEGDDFQRQLQLEASLFWQDAPLRDRLTRFSTVQKVAIWLDRRVDPNQLMNLRAPSQPLEKVILAIARELDCDMCVLDSVVYIGPPAAAARLASRVEELGNDLRLRQTPMEVRAALGTLSKARWPLLTTPREALQQSLRQAGAALTWESLDAVPHDLLFETQLPTLPVAQQLSLLLVGFDLSFTATSPLEIVPLPEPKNVIRTYTVANSVRPRFEKVIAEHRAAKTARQGARFRVEGSPELHRQLRGALRAAKATPATPPDKRYTLKVTQQPVGGVAKQLAAQLGLQLNVDPAAASKLSTRISFQVQEVSRAQLIEAMLAPAALTGEVVNGVLQVKEK